MSPSQLPDSLRLDMVSSLKLLQLRTLQPEEWDSVTALLAALAEALEEGNPSRVQRIMEDIDRFGPTRAFRIPARSLDHPLEPTAAPAPGVVLDYLNRIVHAYEATPPAPAAGGG